MISIYKHSRYSINIEFDKHGARKLIEALENVLNDKRYVLQANSMIEGEIINLIFIKNEITNNILFSKRELKIELDTDEIEYDIQRFTESIREKIFYPSEFCEGSIDKKNVSIYAKYIDTEIK